MTTRLYLETVAGSPVGRRRFDLDRFPATIGRQTDLPVQIVGDRVSRRHARIEVQADGSLRLRDLDSTNGTFLNGHRLVQSETVLPGDVIQVGNIEMRLLESVPAAADASGATTRIDIEPVLDHAPLKMREFHSLLESGQVAAFGQPIVTAEGEAFGYELLGRGTHPELDPSPGALFALARYADAEVRLSELFRRQCFATAAGAGLDGAIFFNTHPAECDQPERLLAELGRLRGDYPGLKLVFEVHESAVTDLGRMAEIRTELDRIGIGLAYDDFGAGQARLHELVDVPPDVLKFDISLVRGIADSNSAKYRMLDTLNRMMREFGIRTLAEGVENADEARACRRIGIDLLQGYHFGRPAPIGGNA